MGNDLTLILLIDDLSFVTGREQDLALAVHVGPTRVNVFSVMEVILDFVDLKVLIFVRLLLIKVVVALWEGVLRFIEELHRSARTIASFVFFFRVGGTVILKVR